MNTSLDLVMTYTAAAITTSIFRGYVQWEPTGTSGLSDDLIVTNGATTRQLFGTLPNLEATAWKALYGKTKLSKVVVKYYPAITMGINQATIGTTVTPTTGSLSQAAVMYTIPIYDNVDDIINEDGTLAQGVGRNDLEDALNKPYSKCHSIYKPWTRVIVPKVYMKSPTWETGVNLYSKRGGYVDLSTGVDMNGLYIAIPPITLGGLQADPGLANQTNYPATGQKMILGRVTFTYYQKFMTRE